MKRVKNTMKKLGKKFFTVYGILVLIIIGLIAYIFIDNADNSKTTKYSQIKVNNDLGQTTACKSNSIRNDITNIVIKFCGNGEVVVLDSSNVSTTATESDATVVEPNTTATDSNTADTSTCTKAVTDEEILNIDNVVNFYSSYNYVDDSYVYYILTGDGKVYTTTQANIINKNYEVTVVEDLDNIVVIDEYITFENNSNMYTNDLYAIDEDGQLHLLRNVY
jgi:flagellar biosynthesis/type III secretory pathway M-ring protein FliF/YscJ